MQTNNQSVHRIIQPGTTSLWHPCHVDNRTQNAFCKKGGATSTITNTMKKMFFISLLLLCSMLKLAAQDTQAAKLEKIQQELSTWMKTAKMNPLPADIEKLVTEQAAIAEPGHTYTELEKKKRYEEVSAFYLENQFWKKNPEYENFVTKRSVGNGQNLCNNGGFENGNTAFTHFGSIFSNGSNNCTFVAGMAWNPTISTGSVSSVANRMEVVNAGIDPVVAGLNRTRNGNRALRINSHLNAAGKSCESHAAQIDKAATTFVVDARTTTLTFWYAVVLQNPSHTESNGRNPFFTARIRNDNTGALIQQICFDPSQNNLQRAGTNCNSNVVWQPWTCATFDLSSAVGQTVTLEFIAADCGPTAHFGYAYIDDICMGCNTLGNNGALTITSNDNCFTNGITFNGTYTVPPVAGATLQSLIVEVRRNGAVVATTTPTFANGTYTGTVPASVFSNNTSYDLIARATFNVPGVGQVITTAEIRPGINNDITASTATCCDPTDSPNFTISTSCNNGVLTVTATSTEPTPTNHWWALMETRISGNTHDTATVGQTSGITSGTSVTYTITDFGKSYYIKHGIWNDGCYTWREVRLPVPTPQASNVFNFEDAAGIAKTTFCFGEDIYLDGTASTGESQYFIDAWRRPIGSTAAFTWYSGLGWTTGQIGVVNLSQLFRSGSPSVIFEPGYEYSIKLALQNPTNCIGWTPREQTFKVVCCDDNIKPNYLLDITPTANNYTLTAQGFTTYTNINAIHEWYVLSSPNQTGGPYTPVTSLTSTTQTSVTLFANAQYGLYYTVIHKVRTLCGEVCIKRVQYQSGLNKAAPQIDTSASRVDCCLAFQFWPNGPGATQEFTAKFDVGATPLAAGQYTINTSNVVSYSNNPSITHEWYVLRSPNPTGGPYTTLTQGTGVNFTYKPASDGFYYFVIHRVKSPCGTVCYGQSICRNCNMAKANCELCGPIDCKILDTVWKPCIAAINLKADCRRNILSWDAVPGNPNYVVEISFNDRACCNTSLLPSSNVYTTTTNSLALGSIRMPQYDCFRWRVMAKCNGEKPVWSEWKCFSCTAVIAEQGQTLDPKQTKQ